MGELENEQVISGLTAQEIRVSNALVEAWNAFVSSENLDVTTDDYIAFRDGIHKCQYVLAHRIIRHMYPEYWV